MKKKVIQTEEHHRRPRSLGGSIDQFNISYVIPKYHRAWHVLFGNMNAEQICKTINSLPWKPEGVNVICKFINGSEVTKKGEHNSKNDHKREAAWDMLFKNASFQEAINYINNVWLDPSYHFYVRR